MRIGAANRVAACVLGLAVSVLALAGPRAAGQNAAASCKVPGGTLRYGLVRDPIALDPHINYGASSATLQGNLYDGLIRYTPDGRLEPALATSWSQLQPSVYVFRLRRGVVFHDGTPFGAADVAFTFKRILDPQTHATRQKDLEGILDAVRVVDPATVEVRLKHPTATFLDMLASREMYVVSQKWGAAGDFKKAENGTGPYRLTAYEPGVRYVLARAPAAWQAACLERVEEVPILDDRARVNALKAGQVEFIEYVPWQDVAYFFRTRGFRAYRGYEVFNFVRLNPTRPPLTNPKVRQALNFVVNREAVSLTAFGGQAQPMDGFLLRKDSWAYDPRTSRVWKTDPQRALALLREAGVARPQDLRVGFDSTTLSVHLDTAQVIATMLRSFGITVDLRLMDVPTLIQKRVTGDYTMMMDGLSLPWGDPDAYYQYFHSTGTAYAAAVHFKDDRLDALLDEGRQLTDPPRRKAVYMQAEQRLYEDAPWIFVVWRPQAEAARSEVRGYARLPAGLGTGTPGYLYRLWIEK